MLCAVSAAGSLPPGVNAEKKGQRTRMTDFLDQTRKEIMGRLGELKPLVEEYSRLEAAASALDGVGRAPKPAASTGTRRRGPGRPRGSASKPAGRPAIKAGGQGTPKVGRPAKRRAGRRKGSGRRAAQALASVREQPGITIPELAAKMGISPNYLYRVLPALAKEKKIKRQGRGWQPTAK
jgi:hypothetical protein